ncbi:MAG TPA: hypothetical protein V6D28_27020 [Leptolyngbyaceae cyanobacterium]
MKPALFLTTAIVTTVSSLPLYLADFSQAQDCLTSNEGLLICLGDSQGNNQKPKKQQRDFYPDSYDRIDNIYRAILDRNADYLALRTWYRELERGRSLGDIRGQLARSPEAENRINQIYLELLGRPVDPDGLRTWQRALARGASLMQIRQYIEEIIREREERKEKFVNSNF